MSENSCVFCRIGVGGAVKDQIVAETETLWAVYDGYPVSPGHILIIPKRHVETWWDATWQEQKETLLLLERVKKLVDDMYEPDGYNVGFNSGEAAGQTVFHAHLHLIPRYTGDVENPQGGVRHVIPRKANYLT